MSRRRRSGEGPDGVAVVDKPAGWTSHDVVAKARGLLGTRKVGHAGTLDPDVTGVLVLGVGRATRLLRFVTGLGKRYEGTFVLGVETTTLDASGDVIATHDMADVTLEQVRAVVAERFTGPILQIPPMVSAVKVDGRRLHELAREGIEVAREPRPVTIRSFIVDEAEPSMGTGSPGETGPSAVEPRVGDTGPPAQVGPSEVADATVDRPVASAETPRFSLSVDCSSGTYIRTLVADVGTALGGGAHLETLRRTAVGSFGESVAVPLAELTPERLLGVEAAVADLATVIVAPDLAARVTHGARLDRDLLGVEASAPGPWAVFDDAGVLLAVYQDHGPGTVKPAVVITPPRPTP